MTSWFFVLVRCCYARCFGEKQRAEDLLEVAELAHDDLLRMVVHFLREPLPYPIDRPGIFQKAGHGIESCLEILLDVSTTWPGLISISMAFSRRGNATMSPQTPDDSSSIHEYRKSLFVNLPRPA